MSRLHDEAMAFADKATVHRLGGRRSLELAALRRAFELERDAALMAAKKQKLEPTRSVLLRSAASLALECGETREAERLVAIGLSGDPPEVIAEELRDLFDTATFDRHLKLRGVKLDHHEFRMSMVGDAVAPGLAESREFNDRLAKVGMIVRRTAARLKRQPFHETGRPKRDIAEETPVYVSAPQAASFAVTLRIGGVIQPSLPGLGLPEQIITEIIDCLGLEDAGKEEELRKRIPDEAYFRNFQALARAIAPDGQRISAVTFISQQRNKIKTAVLRRPRRVTPAMPPEAAPREPRRHDDVVTIQGRLLYASEVTKKNLIKLLDVDNKAHAIRVPKGMMADIVGPMWEQQVVVTAKQEGREMTRLTIDQTQE